MKYFLTQLLFYVCIDLIPKANAQAWLKHLRHTTPTLPFLSPSASQHQRVNISSTTAPALLRLIKAYKPKAGSVTVGVAGYPNVGKSSLINSLKRSKVNHLLFCSLEPPLTSLFIPYFSGLCSCCSSRSYQGATICPTRTRFTNFRLSWRCI